MAVGPSDKIAVQGEYVVHEMLLELLHILALSLSGNELSPRMKQVPYRDGILIGSSQLDSIRNMERIPPPRLLPVIEHTVSVYKLWYEYRDHFPKKSRYTLGDRIDIIFVQLVELLWAAGYQAKDEKLPTIVAAIKKLDGLKFLLRIAWEIRVLDNIKYASLSEPLFEIGKMLGGWKRGLEAKSPAR